MVLFTNQRYLFEVRDIFGKIVRTTQTYWQKIKTEKHRELQFDIPSIILTLEAPDSVHRSVRDPYILLFFKTFDGATLTVVVKYLGANGFVVTAYQTTKAKRKGEQIWPT